MKRSLFSSALALTLVAGLSLTLAPTAAFAQEEAPAAEGQPTKKLGVGDKAPAIEVAKWVKGKEVKSFEKGHVYVMEFWATWCGPCRKAIPHVTELAHKYKDKVTFIGVSVWEQDDKKSGKAYHELVTEFVDKQGDKMDYNVCYDTKAGPEGAMANSWLKAAGQNGIPATFIVDGEGKVAWIGHPMKMEAALAKTLGIEFKEELTMEDQQAAAMNTIRKFSAAMAKDAAEATKIAKEAAEGPMKDNAFALNTFAWEMLDNKAFKNPDLDLAHAWASRAVEITKSKDGMIMDTLALAEFKKGNVAKAIELQTKAHDLYKASAGADEQVLEEMAERLEMFKAAKK